MDWAAIASIVGALALASSGIIIAVVKTAGNTRDQIDKVKAELGKDLGGVKTDIAEMRGQMTTLAAQSVPQEHCRDRHDRIASDLARLQGDLRETQGRLKVLSDPQSGKHR